MNSLTKQSVIDQNQGESRESMNKEQTFTKDLKIWYLSEKKD